MDIVNLTPHVLNIVGDGFIREIEPSGTVARVETKQAYEGDIDGIFIWRREFGEITGLPEPKNGTIYVVSALVQQRTDRQDVYAPGQLVRGEDGHVIGCEGLTANV